MSRRGDSAAATSTPCAAHPKALLGWALLVRCGHFELDEVDSLWTVVAGPKAEFFQQLEERVREAPELLMFRAALDTWDGQGRFDLGVALRVLDEPRLGLVGELLTAIATGDQSIFIGRAGFLVAKVRS